jgi:hypothetical protein
MAYWKVFINLLLFAPLEGQWLKGVPQDAQRDDTFSSGSSSQTLRGLTGTADLYACNDV